MLEPQLKDKYRFQTIILEQYGEAVFINLEDLMWLHKIYCPVHYQSTRRVIWDFIADEYIKPCIAYVLKPGVANPTIPSDCCNGIRFGENEEYISLPNLPNLVWN